MPRDVIFESELFNWLKSIARNLRYRADLIIKYPITGLTKSPVFELSCA
jgi:hypothetical protein